MKALSIKQPFINFILNKEKIYEIRSWKTSYRGNILLCASKKDDCDDETLIRGKAVCIVNLIDIFKYEEKHSDLAKTPFKEGFFAWHLELVEKIEPFKVKGKMGIFEI